MRARSFWSYAGRVPESLRELVAERLAQVGPEARDAASCAALLGYRFEGSLVGACAGLSRARASEAFACMRNLDLIVREPGVPARYRFRHALIQAAVCDALPVERRRTLHARIAAVLEALPDAGRRVEQLAYHWSAAGVESKAAHYCERAAQAALLLGSPGDAAVWRARVS
jgi:predicted ATPase